MIGDAAARWSLSNKGQREARMLARQGFWRDVDLICSSPEPKALQTAEPAARRWGIPLQVVDCLHELRRPQLIPDYERAIARLFADPDQSFASIEPAAHAAERITRCLEELVAAHREQTLAAVSHGLVLTLFLAQLENRWPTVTEWRAVPFAGLTVVDTNTWSSIENCSGIFTSS
jgi:broad specificity phosphatase PhoE